MKRCDRIRIGGAQWKGEWMLQPKSGWQSRCARIFLAVAFERQDLGVHAQRENVWNHSFNRRAEVAGAVVVTEGKGGNRRTNTRVSWEEAAKVALGWRKHLQEICTGDAWGWISQSNCSWPGQRERKRNDVRKRKDEQG